MTGQVRLRRKTRHRVPRRAGFTLIELLVVILILTLLVGVIAASIGAGVRVWDQAMTFNTVEREAAIALRMVERDLANTTPCYAAPFMGKATEAAFPGLVTAPAGADGRDGGELPGVIRYAFDPGARALVREEWGLAGRSAGPTRSERVATGVEAMRWEYLLLTPAGLNTAWQESWESTTNHPAAVRVAVTFRRREAPLTITRSVVLATGIPTTRQEEKTAAR